MKSLRVLVAAVFALWLLAPTAWSADKTPKLTCCQEATAKKKECDHKCCVAAHKAGKSCQKCNPNKEDLPKDKDPKRGGK